MDFETVLLILAAANFILWFLARELRAIRPILEAILAILTGLEIGGLASYGLGILAGFEGSKALYVGGALLIVGLCLLLIFVAAIPILWRFLNHHAEGAKRRAVRNPPRPCRTEVKLYLMSVGISFLRVVAFAVAAEVIFYLLYPTADPSAKSLWAIATATWQDTLCLVAAPFVLGAGFYACSPWIAHWRRAGGRLVI